MHQDVAGGRIPPGLFSDPDDDEDAILRAIAARVARRLFGRLNLEDDSDTE